MPFLLALVGSSGFEHSGLGTISHGVRDSNTDAAMTLAAEAPLKSRRNFTRIILVLRDWAKVRSVRMPVLIWNLPRVG